jgi:hypothetical protein
MHVSHVISPKFIFAGSGKREKSKKILVKWFLIAWARYSLPRAMPFSLLDYSKYGSSVHKKVNSQEKKKCQSSAPMR